MDGIGQAEVLFAVAQDRGNVLDGEQGSVFQVTVKHEQPHEFRGVRLLVTVDQPRGEEGSQRDEPRGHGFVQLAFPWGFEAKDQRLEEFPGGFDGVGGADVGPAGRVLLQPIQSEVLFVRFALRSGEHDAFRGQPFDDRSVVEGRSERGGDFDGVLIQIGGDQQRHRLGRGQTGAHHDAGRRLVSGFAFVGQFEARANHLKVAVDVLDFQHFHFLLWHLRRFQFVSVRRALGTDAQLAFVRRLPFQHRSHDPSVFGVDQFQAVQTSQVTLGLSFEAFQREQLGSEPHPALVHDVGRLAVVLLHHVKRIQEIVVVVDLQVDGTSSRLDDGLQVLKHVDVRIGGQLPQLLPLEKRHDKLPQAVFPAAFVGVGHHGIVSLVVVAQFEMVGEQNVAQGGLVLIVFRANLQRRFGQFDDVVVVAKLLEEIDDFEEVQDGQAVRIFDFFLSIENLRGEKAIGRDAAGRLNDPIAGFFGFTHVDESRPQEELAGMAVPVTPGAQQPHVLLDLHVLAG